MKLIKIKTQIWCLKITKSTKNLVYAYSYYNADTSIVMANVGIIMADIGIVVADIGIVIADIGILMADTSTVMADTSIDYNGRYP